MQRSSAIQPFRSLTAIPVLFGLTMAAGASEGDESLRQSSGDSDFQARCATPGVIRCYGFDDPVDLTTGHPWMLTDPPDSTSSRMYDPWGGPDLCTGGQCWALDESVRASGQSALRFEVPSNSGADTSGSFRRDSQVR
ncbi:MAG: hypothetical protein AAF657_37510 [Acidobacteriota bacterium]